MKTNIRKRNVLVNIDQIEQITKQAEDEHRLYFLSGRDMLISDPDIIFRQHAPGGRRFVEVEEVVYPPSWTGPN